MSYQREPSAFACFKYPAIYLPTLSTSVEHEHKLEFSGYLWNMLFLYQQRASMQYLKSLKIYFLLVLSTQKYLRINLEAEHDQMSASYST